MNIISIEQLTDTLLMVKQELYRVLRDIDDDENAEKEAIRAKYKALYAEKQKQKDITTTSKEDNELKNSKIYSYFLK